MDIMKKLTSRKFWMALAGLIVGILALFSVDGNTATQISGVIMSLGSVIAYIVGEGLVDASAAAPATTVITGSVSAGAAATTPNDPPVVDKVDSTAAEGAPTGSEQAATVKQDTAISDQAK